MHRELLSSRPIARGSIIAATPRLSLTEIEIQQVGGFLFLSEKAARDIELDRDVAGSSGEQLQEMYAEGVVLLASRSVRRRFIVIKVDHGAGLFSDQKPHIVTYVGDWQHDAYIVGPSFESLSRSLNWISSVYDKLDSCPAT